MLVSTGVGVLPVETTSSGRFALASRDANETKFALVLGLRSTKPTILRPAATSLATYEVRSHSYHCVAVELTTALAMGLAPGAGLLFHVSVASDHDVSATGKTCTVIASPIE